MCFSMGASFGASAVLGVVGVLAIRRTTSNTQLLLAAIPFVFSLQQFCEGLVWLSLTNPAYAGWTDRAAHAFLFFAEVLWPVWGPLAVLMIEQRAGRRMTLRVVSVLGLLVGLYLAWRLMFFPVQTSVIGHHIRYEQYFPLTKFWFAAICYFVPTVMPFFISSTRKMWIMGVSVLASYVVTHLFYGEYLTSVWCFLAAVISIEVFLIVRAPRRYRPREMSLRPIL